MGIELGHYLAVLATEYRLLERDGADLTSIRNELYYAINAVNRLDKNAEPYYDLSISSNNSSNLNGFLIREDIPHGFYRRWRDVGDNINNQGSENSGIFAFEINTFRSQPRFFDESGNVIIEDSDENTVVDERFDHDYNHRKKYGNKWNEFSQDQLIGLLLGLRFVVKFVDNDFVKPTSADPGFYIITETKNIIERLLDHTAEIKDCGSQIQHTDDGSCSQYIEDADCDALTNNCGIDNLHGRWIIKNPIEQKAVYRGPVSYTMGLCWPMAVMGKNILNKDYPWESINLEIDRVGNDPNLGRTVDCKEKFELAIQLYQTIADPESEIGAWLTAIDQIKENQNYYNVNMAIRAAAMAGKDQDDE